MPAQDVIQHTQDFAIAFASKAIAKKRTYRERLKEAIETIFEYADNDWETWDSGHPSMTTTNNDFFYDTDYTKKFQLDVTCAIRIAVDLFVEMSGGVTGYSIGDLKKAFDGKIPCWVNMLYETDLNAQDENASIWL